MGLGGQGDTNRSQRGSIKANIRAVESFVEEGLMSKAVAQGRLGICQKHQGYAGSPRAFASRAGLVAEELGETIGEDLPGNLLKAAAKAICMFPQKSSQGQRFSF